MNYNELIIRALHEELSKHTKLELTVLPSSKTLQIHRDRCLLSYLMLHQNDIHIYTVEKYSCLYRKEKIYLGDPSTIDRLIALLKTLENDDKQL